VGETFRLLHKPGIRQRYQQAIRSADALIAISRFTEEGYRRLVPEAQNIVPLPNGVHLDTFAARHDPPLGLDADVVAGRYLLCLGRLSRRKGVDVLLEALARMGDAGAGYPLVVAGDGDERAALEQLAARLSLGSRVRFVGAVGGAGKSWLLQNAALLCLPSRDWEAFPLVVLEGYAAGCPIVASRISGLMDLVSPGETGWLVEPESPGDLAATLVEALADSSHLQRAQQYDWSAVAGRHLELFQRLIAGGAARRAA
jgi:glycosyltransferase involved in cell wall biosynthesis